MIGWEDLFKSMNLSVQCPSRGIFLKLFFFVFLFTVLFVMCNSVIIFVLFIIYSENRTIVHIVVLVRYDIFCVEIAVKHHLADHTDLCAVVKFSRNGPERRSATCVWRSTT